MTGPPRRNGSLNALLLVLVLCSCGCRPGAERAPGGPPLRLSLAVLPAPYSALIAVADEMGYFKDAGIEVVLALRPSGRESLEAVGRGEAQVAPGTVTMFR